MSNYLVGSLLGYGVGFVFNAIISVLRKRMWIQRAHKLAARSDIALPGPLVGRVARFLRNQFLFGQLVSVLAIPFTAAVIDGGLTHRNWAAWVPWMLAGLPLFWAIFCFALGLWPRWKASGGYRVTHLGSVSIRQAFTPAEVTALVIGVVASAAFGAWGLLYVAAPATWWLACAAALAAALAAWRYAAASIMKRPSSASDAIELGWDDLLRFKQVREITAGVVWAPALFVYLIDCMMSSAFVHTTTAPGEVSAELQWWPFIVPIVTGVVLARVFRQGRHLWRRAWMERDAGGRYGLAEKNANSTHFFMQSSRS